MKNIVFLTFFFIILLHFSLTKVIRTTAKVEEIPSDPNHRFLSYLFNVFFPLLREYPSIASKESSHVYVCQVHRRELLGILNKHRILIYEVPVPCVYVPIHSVHNAFTKQKKKASKDRTTSKVTFDARNVRSQEKALEKLWDSLASTESTSPQ